MDQKVEQERGKNGDTVPSRVRCLYGRRNPSVLIAKLEGTYLTMKAHLFRKLISELASPSATVAVVEQTTEHLQQTSADDGEELNLLCSQLTRNREEGRCTLPSGKPSIFDFYTLT